PVALVSLQPGQALVGKARVGDGLRLLDPVTFGYPLPAHLADGVPDGLALPYQRCGQDRPILRSRSRPAVAPALLDSARRLSGGVGLCPLLDPSRVSSRLPVEISCRAP